MRFNLCTNINNGVGLQADYLLLRRLLESWGHHVDGVHFRNRAQIGEARQADVNIFLEVIAYDLVSKANNNWLIPNPDWLAPLKHQDDLPAIQRNLCKTKEAERIFADMFGPSRIVYIGFESSDLYDPSVPRIRKCLHVAGQSPCKNSETAVQAFGDFFDEDGEDKHRELVFVGRCSKKLHFPWKHKNIRYIPRASDLEVKKLMNECLFHVMPSGTEGWGHVLHEGMGCANVVISTDCTPMNEYEGIAPTLRIPPQRIAKQYCAHRAFVRFGNYELS